MAIVLGDKGDQHSQIVRRIHLYWTKRSTSVQCAILGVNQMLPIGLQDSKSVLLSLPSIWNPGPGMIRRQPTAAEVLWPQSAHLLF